jgi:hypothetical protein
MIHLPPPAVRCTRVVALPSGARVRCTGWAVTRHLEPLEPPGHAYACLDCSADYEIIAGALVAITRPAGTPLPRVPIAMPPARPPGRPRKVEVV